MSEWIPVDKTIVFTGDLPEATLLRRVRRGDLVRLATGVYTNDVRTASALVVQREWHTVAGQLFPNAVVTDRSAQTGGPVQGVLYLAHPARERRLTLPGLTVRARPGAGPQLDDIPLPGGLHQASKGRALAENARATRARGEHLAATFDEVELADWIDRLCRIDGEERLAHYRRRAEELAVTVGATETAINRLNQLLGAALGTQDTDASPALVARRSGNPYDPDRLARFDVLIDALRESVPQNLPADESRPRYQHLPFYEAYFSNYIEGTEFEIDEAIALVYAGVDPGQRTADAHDLISTWRIASDRARMAQTATTASEYLDLLRHRHNEIMSARPEKNPGVFKERANQAGNSLFVLPNLVVGTLRAGFDRVADLDTAWEKAVYAMFLVSEVHPFDDGNGRLARIMMNSELVAGRQSRIVIPTVFREDYLGALRRLTRDDDPSVLIKSLRIGQEYTSRIDFSDLEKATNQLRATAAFEVSDADHRLAMPTR